MRLVFALALALAGVASGTSSATPRVAPSDGPAPAGQECHCAVQAQPTTLVLRAGDREHEREPRLDASGDLTLRVQGLDAGVERLATRGDVTLPAAATPRRGYDATAPPASPLA